MKNRKYPDKPANLRGSHCSHCDEVNGKPYCMYGGYKAIEICGGNPHNCMKVDLHNQASLSNKQLHNNITAKGISVNKNGNLYNPY